MAVYNDWTVEYKNGATWTEIPNVQDLSCSVGRQTAVEQWPASTASIRVWYPEGWASPIANLTAGTKIRFFAPGRSSTKPSWTGEVKDLRLEIGIPWNSVTSDGNADFLVIECEGYIATAGRYVAQADVPLIDFDDRRFPMQSFIQDYLQLASNNRDKPNWVMSYDSTSSAITTDYKIKPGYLDTQTWYLYPMQQLQAFVAFGLFRLIDGVRKTWAAGAGSTDDPGMYVGAPPHQTTITSVGFSDTTNNATNRIYDQIEFDSLADQYYNASDITYIVQYDAPGAPTVVKADLGVFPLRSYRTEFPQYTSQLGALPITYEQMADYYANVFSPADIAISSISATTNGQHTQNLDTLGVADLELGYLPLYAVPVTLRGQTFYCQIEGVQVTADTNSARFTYYVTPTGTTGWFTLDSAAFGVLDDNRLGIY